MIRTASVDEPCIFYLSKSHQFIRISLQNGTAPFGFATKGTGSTYDYSIGPKSLNEYIG